MSSSSQGDEARRALEADNRIHQAICDWIREDAPLTVKMGLMPEHVAALVRRLAALRADPVRAAEEMETELRPFASGEGEGLDEIVVHGSATVHAETMSDTALWIGISDEAGGLLHVWINAVRRKGKTLLVMTASDEGERDTIRALPIQPAAEGGADEGV